MPRDDELALIKKIQSGDMDSFDILVGMFREKGFSLAYQWTNNQEDALDVLQEAFIKMYKVIPTWKPESSLFTWLYRVIINQAIDLKRRKSRMSVISDSANTSEGSEIIQLKASDIDRPDRQIASRELSDFIHYAVMSLPPKQKEVFILKNFQGLALKEIADICRCPIGTVKATLFQAVQKLRERLAEFTDRGTKNG